MARKATTLRSLDSVQESTAQSKEVRSVGIREFRETIREICEAGEPVIVTRGSYIAGVFFVANLNAWRHDENRDGMVEEIKAEFPNVKRAIERK